MATFQREPDKLTNRCDRCHNVFFVGAMKSTSEGDPYCPTCGFVFGTSVAPASWVCEDCAEVVLDHGDEDRPWCKNCELPMSCVRATASSVHGAGTGIADLDLGLVLLLESEEALMVKGGNILKDLLEK